jgi:hypothetical protein
MLFMVNENNLSITRPVVEYSIVAISSLIFGLVFILLQILVPAVDKFVTETFPNSIFSFYIPYIPVYIYMLIRLFRQQFTTYAFLTFLGYIFIGTLFYSIGFYVVLSNLSLGGLGIL